MSSITPLQTAPAPVVRLQPGLPPVDAKLPGAAHDRFAASPTLSPLARTVLDHPTLRNRVTLHPSAKESLDALLGAIKGAKHSFYIETFIWHDDAAGRQVMRALLDRKRAAARRGETFDVKILVEGSTCRGNDARIVSDMQAAGLDVKLFHPKFVDLKATGCTPLTHRKLYIADGDKFLSGGRNIGNEYLLPVSTGENGKPQQAWHDLMYTIEGEETGRVLDAFTQNWARAGGAPFQRPVVRPVAGGSVALQTFTTSPFEHAHGQALRKAQLRAIGAARQEIRLVYPFFSDRGLVDALIAAKQRNPGLKVLVMLPGRDEHNPIGWIFNHLNEAAAARLVAAGVEVRKIDTYHDGAALATTFTHLKAMAIDGELLSVGSANADTRTMNANHELITMIADKPTAQRFISQVLAPDWETARPVTHETLARRSWTRRLLDRVLTALSPLT